MSIEGILETVIAEVGAGRPAALCVIVAARGSTPQPAGTMLCVDHAARITGTLGGGCVEAEVRRRAHQLLSAGRSELITFALDHDFGYDDGMICGGQMDVAVSIFSSLDDANGIIAAREQLAKGHEAMLLLRVRNRDSRGRLSHTSPAHPFPDAAHPPSNEAHPPSDVEYRLHLETAPELLIAGAGHISRILAPLVVRLGFRVCVIDDRLEYANADRFPPPIRTIVADIAGTLRTWPLGGHTYLVIVTRGHKHDEEALAAVLVRESTVLVRESILAPARYIGMIGSRRKIKVIFDDLLQGGVTPEQLEGVHAPVGLDIGAVTTEEIALSIAAELVSVRRANRGRAVEGPFPVPESAP